MAAPCASVNFFPPISMLATLLRIFLILALAAPLDASAPPRPNIIFIITDDQGYGDLGAHGNPILKTPHLDRLHSESVRFTDFHVSPTCSPTRAALLTGRHEFKNGVTHTIHERERLAPGAVTLPQVLKAAGYTTGIFGKWHLGDEPEYWPVRRGFDEMFIHGAGGIGQSFPGSCGDAPGNSYFDPAILHNGVFVTTEGYCTDVFFDEAMRWIGAVKDKAPFYCHIATNTPHTPLDARPEDEALYAGKVPPDTAKFFGMIANIDANIGRLLTRLAEWNIERQTLIVFMNDNGGTGGVKLFNAGMRGAKGSPWLGGTRAISLWRWPGSFAPADCNALTAHIDFFPTLAEFAGAQLDGAAASQIEGRSLAPLLRAPAAPWPERHLITHVGRWEKGKFAESKYLRCSIRTPRWHMVNDERGGRRRWQLFDVAADYGQKQDIASEHPAIVAELEAKYSTWWDSLAPYLVNEDATGPAVNPFKELYWKQFGGGPKK